MLIPPAPVVRLSLWYGAGAVSAKGFEPPRFRYLRAGWRVRERGEGHRNPRHYAPQL